MIVTPRKRSRSGPLLFCHNRCRSGAGTLKSASHVAWMIGYSTPLCGACAKAWPVLWDQALDDVERVAA